MNAFKLGQMTDRMTLKEFELASIDERLVARFEGTLDDWWSIFWTSVAASVAKEARAKYYGRGLSPARLSAKTNNKSGDNRSD